MRTGFLRGIDGVVAVVKVERHGLPMFEVVGLADAAVRETRVRVQAAVVNSGLRASESLRINLEPLHAKKDGTAFDLPIALACLGCDGAALGELSLNGEIRPVRGVLPIVEALQQAGEKLVVVAPENAQEAELVEGIVVLKCRTLKEAYDVLNGLSSESDRFPVDAGTLDMRDVRGLDDDVKRELEAVAVSGENVMLVGGPGAGKTMLARRLVGILPGMTEAEAKEVTRCHSAAGINIGGGMITQRPFRAPHHSTTPPGLVGGGTAMPRPGEVTLAHNGVLFLDEVTEFSRTTIEVMREVATSREVILSRASGTLRFPAKCQIVASANPCPCGRLGAPSTSGATRCRCDADAIKRHNARIDEVCRNLKITKRINVPNVDLAKIDNAPAGEDSATIRGRVEAARGIK